MITMTIGNALESSFLERDDKDFAYAIYIIRNDDGVLYIGESYAPRERLRQHRYTRSEIGLWISMNEPTSFDWVIEFYTLRDFGIDVKSIYQAPKAFKEHARAIERRLIEEHQPIFNEGLR